MSGAARRRGASAGPRRRCCASTASTVSRMSGLTGSKLLWNEMLWTLPCAMYSAIAFAGRLDTSGTFVGAGKDSAGPGGRPARRRTRRFLRSRFISEPRTIPAATVGNMLTPTRDAIAVRRPRSAIAEVSTMARWSSVRSERSGSPSRPASAPGTSGIGMGSSTFDVIVVSLPRPTATAGSPSPAMLALRRAHNRRNTIVPATLVGRYLRLTHSSILSPLPSCPRGRALSTQ